MDVFYYLHNPEALKSSYQFDVFKMGPKKDIRATIGRSVSSSEAVPQNKDINIHTAFKTLETTKQRLRPVAKLDENGWSCPSLTFEH